MNERSAHGREAGHAYPESYGFGAAWDDDSSGSGWTESAAAARDWAREKRDEMGQQASHLRHAVRDRAQNAQRGFEHLLHEQPLVAGALGIALGAALGALLPSTDTEDQWLGDTSDRVKELGKDKARRQLDEERESFRSAAAGGAERPRGTSDSLAPHE
jgi:ElaB/YqjD/DUF883 family membrane-anchored ribosome-binding protein